MTQPETIRDSAFHGGENAILVLQGREGPAAWALHQRARFAPSGWDDDARGVPIQYTDLAVRRLSTLA